MITLWITTGIFLILGIIMSVHETEIKEIAQNIIFTLILGLSFGAMIALIIPAKKEYVLKQTYGIVQETDLNEIDFIEIKYTDKDPYIELYEQERIEGKLRNKFAYCFSLSKTIIYINK